MAQTLGCETITTQQETIANLARQAPGMVLTTLAHHIDLMWLEEAYRRTRKDGAVGVDGVTAEAYEASLHENLSDLLERFKSGRYRAPPVRRVHIPKDGTKKTRPIGIPTLEDKILRLMRRNVWSSLRRIWSGHGVAYSAKGIGNTLHTVGPMSQDHMVFTLPFGVA